MYKKKEITLPSRMWYDVRYMANLLYGTIGNTALSVIKVTVELLPTDTECSWRMSTYQTESWNMYTCKTIHYL